MVEDNDFSEHESESSTWIALADLMTGLMAIFLVLFLIIMTNQSRTRLVIIQAIETAMKKEGIKVEVDPKTGDTSISDNILFDNGSAELSVAGKQFLSKFIPVYSEVLFRKLKPEEIDQISHIVIEGHGSRDNNTSYDYSKNMTLSLRRSDSVIQYVSTMPDFSYKDQLIYKLTPAGRGNLDAKPYNDPADRKVLFKFQFTPEFQKMLSNKQIESGNFE